MLSAQFTAQVAFFNLKQKDVRYYQIKDWSSGRAADRDGFENRCTLTGTGGSNPSCSGRVLIIKAVLCSLKGRF